MADYIPIRTLRPHWRNFFDDETVIDLDPDLQKMRAKADRIEPGPGEQVMAFLDYAGKQYDMVERGYFENGLDTVRDFMKFYEPSAFSPLISGTRCIRGSADTSRIHVCTMSLTSSLNMSGRQPMMRPGL